MLLLSHLYPASRLSGLPTTGVPALDTPFAFPPFTFSDFCSAAGSAFRNCCTDAIGNLLLQAWFSIRQRRGEVGGKGAHTCMLYISAGVSRKLPRPHQRPPHSNNNEGTYWTNRRSRRNRYPLRADGRNTPPESRLYLEVGVRSRCAYAVVVGISAIRAI